MQKKKTEKTFKSLGSGHRLNNESEKSTSSSNSAKNTVSSKEAAAEAALKRLELEQKKNDPSKAKPWVKAEAKKLLEKEQQLEKEQNDKNAAASNQTRPSEPEAPKTLAVRGVYFTCELLGDEVCLPRIEMFQKLEARLNEDLQNGEDPVLIATLMLYSLNRSDPRAAAIEILNKYLNNIINSPTEPKYRRIRITNRVYQEKVASAKGGPAFLKAAGFVEILEATETFLLYPAEESIDRLSLCLEYLNNGEAAALRLYRDPQIFAPGSSPSPLGDENLPAEFFNLTPKEMNAVQQELHERVENLSMLQTNKMREEAAARKLRKYKYCLVRVKFPEGHILQGTFQSKDTFLNVLQFVSEHLIDETCLFSLRDPLKGAVSGEKVVKQTLAELDYVPAALFHFEPETPNQNGQYLFLE